MKLFSCHESYYQAMCNRRKFTPEISRNALITLAFVQFSRLAVKKMSRTKSITASCSRPASATLCRSTSFPLPPKPKRKLKKQKQKRGEGLFALVNERVRVLQGAAPVPPGSDSGSSWSRASVAARRCWCPGTSPWSGRPPRP